MKIETKGTVFINIISVEIIENKAIMFFKNGEKREILLNSIKLIVK